MNGFPHPITKLNHEEIAADLGLHISQIFTY